MLVLAYVYEKSYLHLLTHWHSFLNLMHIFPLYHWWFGLWLNSSELFACPFINVFRIVPELFLFSGLSYSLQMPWPRRGPPASFHVAFILCSLLISKVPAVELIWPHFCLVELNGSATNKLSWYHSICRCFHPLLFLTIGTPRFDAGHPSTSFAD